MLEKDVPQDAGIFAEGQKEVCYAVNEEGRYLLARSSGWEPKNIANDQAWDLLAQQLDAVRSRVLGGELSPLAFHMAKNQMDLALLAQYSGMFRWRIRRHLKPTVFSSLKRPLLEHYAALLKTTVDELTDLDHVREFQFRTHKSGLD
jgi:hypothetical protein